jgi:hypothetical protein
LGVESLLALSFAAFSVIGSIFALPWMIQRKLNEAISVHLEDYLTEVELMRQYVLKSDHREYAAKIESELRFLRRGILSIARAVKADIELDHE